MFSYFKEKKKNKQEILNTMTKFVEGMISTEEFWVIYQNDSNIHKMLAKCKELSLSSLQIEKININSLQSRIQIYNIVKRFLEIKNYKVTPFNIEEEKYNFAFEIIPEWLEIYDVDFLNNIVNSAPQNLSKDEIRNWSKEEVQKLFKYDKYPPEWLTMPDWPIVNGKPMIFKEVIETVENGIIKNEFVFYNEDGEIKRIQWDYQ